MNPDREHMRFYAFVERQNGASASEIHRKLVNCIGEEAPGHSTVKRWCNSISDGDFTLKHAPRSGRPRTSGCEENIGKIADLIAANPRLSTRQISAELDTNKETVRQILVKELKMRKVCSVWVPHSLTEAHRADRVACAQQILEDLRRLGDSVSRCYAVIDETWVPFKPLATKQENKVWLPVGAKRHAIPRPSLTKEKCMLLVIYTANGKINCSALPYGQTVNSERYCQFLKDTGNKWRNLRSHPTRLCEIELQQDNARPHVSAFTKEFLHQRNVRTIRQPPYSPDFNMLDRWLFAHLKKTLRKTAFSNATEVETLAKQLLRQIPNERMVHEVSKLQCHLQHVIENNGDYVV